jgi:hypothetical protein
MSCREGQQYPPVPFFPSNLYSPFGQYEAFKNLLLDMLCLINQID